MPTARKRKCATQEAADFSFSSGAAPFADKNAYATSGVTFAIAAVEYDENGGFTGAPRWKVTVTRDDTNATEIISLSTNAKRDAQLRDAQDHVAAKGPIRGVRLVKRNNAFYFRSAASGDS